MDIFIRRPESLWLVRRKDASSELVEIAMLQGS